MTGSVEADFAAASGEVTVPSPETMRAVGEVLGGALRAGDVVVLTGALGAGKTTLTQGIARGVGAAGRVQSPTFTIVRVHRPGLRPDGTPGTGMLHMDAYRLLGDAVHTALRAGGAELSPDDLAGMLESLDVDDDLSDRVLVAEWGRGVVEPLSDRVIDVEILRDVPACAGAGEDDAETRRLRWNWVMRP